jgi:hypothetical protein
MSFFADLGLDPLSLAIVMLAFVAGGFVKGVLGFGLPLTTLAIIPFVAPIGVGLATNAIVAFLANMSQFMEGGLGRKPRCAGSGRCWSRWFRAWPSARRRSRRWMRTRCC